MREGFYFSVSLSAYTVSQDIDKTMLVRLSSLEAAGIYTVAYRVIEIALVPVRSFLAATYPKFFQRGSSICRARITYLFIREQTGHDP